MKTVMLMLMVLVVLPVSAETVDTRRYDRYSFSPNYESIIEGQSNIIEKELDDFYYVEKIKSATVNENSLALYRVNVRESRIHDFVKKVEHKEIVLKQKRDNKDRMTWDAVSFISQSGENKLILKTSKYEEFFSFESRRDYDYYGCIDSKPVYTASLIEGKSDYFFVVTATEGSPVDLLVNDNLNLLIISNKGDLQLSEKLFWANYYPTKNGPKVHFYGEGTTNSKFGEMPIDDGFGRKRYAKMFISDLDEDNRLEIMFWFKTYKSTYFTEKKGFLFEKESFKLYKENTVGSGFDQSSLEADIARKLLADNKMAWESGYPTNNSLCEGWLKDLPIMMEIVEQM